MSPGRTGFLNFALSSAGESVSGLHAYHSASQISEADFERLDVAAYKLENGLKRLIESLQTKQESGTWEDNFAVKEEALPYRPASDEMPWHDVGTEEDCEMGTAEASILTSEQDESEKKDGEPEIKPQKSFLELNQPKPKNEELEHRTVFVGNVPKELIKEAKHHTLKKLFNPFGKIETIRYRSVTSAKPTMLKKVAAYRYVGLQHG